VVETNYTPSNRGHIGKIIERGDNEKVTPMAGMERKDRHDNVLGYKPTCEHPHTQEEAVPGIVFDPFIGSGTTGQVAEFFGYNWLGVDISYEYLNEQAKKRVSEPIKGKSLERLQALRKEGLDD